MFHGKVNDYDQWDTANTRRNRSYCHQHSILLNIWVVLSPFIFLLCLNLPVRSWELQCTIGGNNLLHLCSENKPVELKDIFIRNILGMVT